jgi:hypothetical protein
MTLETHLTFNRTILVDGRLAAETTKDDAPTFEAAYRTLFPNSKIETYTAFQLTKLKHQQKEDIDNAEE